ncbi:MAG TPA: hypothetical protein VGW34_02310 [Allosphingosinicella sp.]|nr:hypothetical protein [Allosphingosinicella sp.]
MEPVQGEAAAAGGAETTAEGSASLAEVADKVSKRIATALVIASAIVGLAIYKRPAPNQFQAFAAGGEVFRVNTATGTILACNAARCMTVVQRGQSLVGFKRGKLFHGQPAPAPAPAPAALPPAARPTS